MQLSCCLLSNAAHHCPFAQLYLESNPGMARLPPSAAAVLSRLRVLSIDCRCPQGIYLL